MERRLLVWFTVCWVLGSAAASSLSGPGTVLAGAGLLAALAAAALLRRSTWPAAAACLAAYGLAAGQRMWADARNVTSLPVQYSAAIQSSPAAAAVYAAELAGVIVSAPEIDGDRVQFRVAGRSISLTGRDAPSSIELGGERMLVQVKLAAETELRIAAGWRRGQQVNVTGELSVPGSSTNFGGFDYRRYLLGQRIHWLLGADGAAAVRASAGSRLSLASQLQHMDAVRAALGRRMDALYPGVQGGYMKGLVLGISEDLDPTMFRQFSQLGLTHILAISGLHVAVFLYVLGGLLRLTRMTRERMLLILIAAVPFYVLLAGASPSVVRSGIMAMLGLAAARMHKLKDGLHLLAAAALLMLLWDPYMLGNVGFQLSFLVTAGLILGAMPVRRLFPGGNPWWKGALFDLLSVTMVAQAVSLPLTLYYFNGLHLLSVAANLVLVPFISFIVMPLGGASLLLDGMWHPAGVLLAEITAIGNELTFGFVFKLSEMKSFRLIWATPALWWVAGYYAALAALFFLLKRRQENRTAAEQGNVLADSNIAAAAAESGSKGSFASALSGTDAPTQPLSGLLRSAVPAGASTPFITLPLAASSRRFGALALVVAIAALAALLIGAYAPDYGDRSAYVDFLDVGQGDSVYIRTPEGRHILIDGGGAVSFGSKESWRQRADPFEVGQKLVVPLLQQRGVHHIDLLVLSHLDSDHIKGLQAVVDAIPVRAILWNGTVKASKDAVSLLRAAVDARIPLYQAAEGLTWTMDSYTSLRSIGTPPGISQAEAAAHIVPDIEEQNGQSVALLITLYNRQFLFTGDADAAEEHAILEQLQAAGEQSEEAAAANQYPIDVMKVSHHGSKSSTSDEWLAYWKPDAAVISVGRSNTYGHPHQTVVSRLQERGAAIYRTDSGGEIQFRIRPSGILEHRERLLEHHD